MKQIISPHIDDAMLSLGGSILNWLKEGEQVRIIDVFSISQAINKDAISVLGGKKYPTDFKSAMKIKKAEEKKIQSIFGLIDTYNEVKKDNVPVVAVNIVRNNQPKTLTYIIR